MNINKKQDPTEAILVITVGFLVISLVSGERWAAIVAVAAGCVGVFSATLSRFVALGWYKLADVLGQIVPNILLSAVFFLVLLPLALLARFFSKNDNLQLRAPEHTGFKDIPGVFDVKTFERPW